MFIFNCVALSIFMTITIILIIKKKCDFVVLMLTPTIALAFFYSSINTG